MKDSQSALYETVTEYVTTNGRADVAIVGLGISAAAVGFGWVGRHRFSMSVAVATRVIGLVLGIVVLAMQVTFGGWLTDVDHALMKWLVDHRNPVLDHVALAVTNGLGPVTTAGLAVVVGVVVAVRFRSVTAGGVVVATVGGASALSWLLKRLVGRSRPPASIQEALETDFSFPSGHVTGTAALFGILAAAVALTGHRVATALLVALTILAVTTVALSRLYLGVHWVTDVAAGACLGTAAVTIGAAALRGIVARASAPALAAAVPTGDAKVLT